MTPFSMESKSEPLKQLETLYRQAKTPPERTILLQTMRIISPEECSRLEEVLQRQQVRNMPFEELVTLVSKQRGITADDARHAVADLVFDQLLDRSQLELLDSPAPPLATVSLTALKPPPPPLPRPSAPKPLPAIPRIQILEAKPAPEVEEHPTEKAPEPEPSRSGGGFMMPKNIPAE